LGGAPPESTVLKIGLIPVVDTVPVYVASQKGYFKAQGITVELVPVKGAQERDALMQAGEIDGMLADLVAVGLFNRDKVQLKTVATARRASPGSPMFRVVAAPGAGLASAADLAGVPVAISHNTVIQYVTERLLAAQGLSADQIKETEVSAIPVRFEQLMNGQIRAATLPDPMGQGALAAGAQLIVDDGAYAQYAQTVLCFSQAAIGAKPTTVRKFLKAWGLAVTDLNGTPDQFADLLVEQGRVPDSIRGSYHMPVFSTGEVPSQAEWEDVVNWLMEKKLIERPLEYGDSIQRMAD
jgi:NitT/TauT family transport system substrate-binding protein